MIRLASSGGYRLYREAGVCVLRLSITRTIFSASEYMVSTKYLISSAQSTAVRCSLTLTWCVSPRGSTKANILTVPFRTYSESVFGRFRESLVKALLSPPEAGMAFHPCTRPDVFHHRDVRKHQGHPPYRL